MEHPDADGEASLGLADLLLAEISPKEVPLLAVFGPALLERGSTPARDDGALGFGVDDVAWLSAAVPVAAVVVSFLREVAADALKDVIKDVTKDAARSWLDALRGRRAGRPAPPPPLPADVANRAAQIAYEHALVLGLDDGRARTLGAAVHGSLLIPVP